MAIKLDFTFYEGDHERLIFESPTSLVNSWVWLTVKLPTDTREDDTEAVVQKIWDPAGITSAGITVSVPVTEAVIEFTPEDTEAMEVGTNYRYDLQTKDPGGLIKTHFHGTIKLQQKQITHAS